MQTKEQKDLAIIIADLEDANKLTQEEKNNLKKFYSVADVEIASACVKNDIAFIIKKIKEKKDISICNGKILRFCIMSGFVDLSMLLLKNNIEP